MVDVLADASQFRSLSLKDLLEARDQYHWHLINKANVVGTAVGLYLIRKTDPPLGRQQHAGPHPRPTKDERRFDTSEVRPYSWPCVLVLVREWVKPSEFGRSLDADQIVPRRLYLPDGRSVPVCVVLVSPAEALAAGPASVRWPDSYLGGGCPIVLDVQGAEHLASVGCLVTDGHKVYALTNRHVSGAAGEAVLARVRGNLVRVGRASPKQLTRRPFTEVFPEFPGRRTFLTLDIGLVDLDNVYDWRSQPYGLPEPLGEVADLNELNLSLRLIDQPVVAFGAASGKLEGQIKALFYRHAAMAGYDFVSEFLIAPSDGATQTRHGDSGTVWHLRTPAEPGAAQPSPVLRPLAVEWGGQALAGPGQQRFNFALATGLSTACELLGVDLVRDHNTGPNPFWGQTGHYSIATAAIDAVQNPSLKALLKANLDRISFQPGQLTPEQIRTKLANAQFIELADVPDLVWKKTPDRVPGGRDVRQNSGPEHPNHYADIDEPDRGHGPTLRELTLQGPDLTKMDVEVWRTWYKNNGKTNPNEQGLLPFRVWQFFTLLVSCLRAGDLTGFVCAAGIVSHYVGDACQPLHGSYHSDGFKELGDAQDWPGKGVHSTYEDKMVDTFSDQLLPAIGPKAAAFNRPIPAISTGQAAAFATVSLMDYVAQVLPPTDLCNTYIRAGGGTSPRVVQALWKAFGDQTAAVMGAGARYLAAIWDAALAASGAVIPTPDTVAEDALAQLYQRSDFAPSLTLDRIQAAL